MTNYCNASHERALLAERGDAELFGSIVTLLQRVLDANCWCNTYDMYQHGLYACTYNLTIN